MWQVRHEGSPRIVKDLTLERVVEGLRDGLWEPTDEVLGPGEAKWSPIEGHPQLAEAALEIEPPRRPHREDETRLDMNALIDVCLVLLIFFILTTTYAAAVQKVVPLPTLKADGKKARVVRLVEVKNRMIRLQAHLDPSGKPVVTVENQTVNVLKDDGTSIDADKVTEALRPYLRGADRKSEIILDAQGISWGTVIAIQDGAKAAGIQSVHHLLRK